MSLTLDRKAFIDILTEGQGDIGAVMQPPPSGLWGMPPVKGLVTQANSIYNGQRFEDLWLDN
jgi:hypothetical protein